MSTDAMLEDLRTLVETESPSRDLDALAASAEAVATVIENRLGGQATGPGVFDMLGGLVQAVHGLAALDDRSGVEILVTADEEVGSFSSRALIEERARACGAVLVLEVAADGER